jgi:hypothetical protein
MTEIEEQARQGKEMLKDVALRYARQHGLRPDKIEWENSGGDEWLLRVETSAHSVKIVFSLAELEDFPGGGPDIVSSKAKIRNAFASLSM